MKNFGGAKKIAVKAGSADSEMFREIFGQDTGTRKILTEPGLCAYLLSDGTTVELYGPGFTLPDYLFSKGNMVVSYRVQHLDRLLESLCQKGAALLGQIETVCTAYRYCHILTPGQTVIGLYEQA